MTLQIQHTTEDLLSEFRRDCLDRGMGGESIRRYLSCLGIFIDFLKEKGVTLQIVGYEELIEYIRLRRTTPTKTGRPATQKTLENDFSAIAAFYDFAEFKSYIQRNPVPPIRKRYLSRYKQASPDDSEKDAKTIEQVSMLINSILNTRDKAIVLVLLKTGVRRGELIALNVSDIDWEYGCFTLASRFKKRSNKWVFFDDETSRVLKQWLRIREGMNPTSDALFVGERGERLERNGVYTVVTKYAEKVGLHNPKSTNVRDHFNVHSCRHWFTTWLRRNNMDREIIKILRGDRRKDSMSVYDHFTKDELRNEYLARIPQLGV